MTEMTSYCGYVNEEELKKICRSFENQSFVTTVSFMGENVVINNCNAVGIIIESLFYRIIRSKLCDFEEGPRQNSPDFYGDNRTIEFEQKMFLKNPGFDISNLQSYINQLCADDGVNRKLFRTKYMIFEYDMGNDNVIIKKFHYLNVWNIVSFTSKTPLSMQIKNGTWHNIRPDSVKKWYDTKKTPKLFIDRIIKCIELCSQITDKQNKIANISSQFDILRSKYTL